MEKITVTVKTKGNSGGKPSRIAQIWIGQEEVPSLGKSISQLLNDMQEQGWNLVRATAYPHVSGTSLTYSFERSLAMAEV